MEAKQLSNRLQLPRVDRENYSLSTLFQRVSDPQALIVTKNGWRYEDQTGHQFSFHPNLSALRIKQLQNGKKDMMIQCSGMIAGDQVLDCTMGMAADAIVASYVVGESGKVTALESQTVIATLVRHGLKTYQTKHQDLKKAMQRVEVMEADYRKFLPHCPDQSYDIVLFDPMFRQTVKASSAMQQLKPIANPSPVDLISVEEAVRVARRAVLLKERKGSPEFSRLGFSIIGESSTYAWGIRKTREDT